jgi:hypothetical protein
MSTLNLENIKHPDSASNNISVDSSGNTSVNGKVGIGTASPATKAHIVDTNNSATNYLNSDATVLVTNNGTGDSVLKLEGDGSIIYGSGSSTLRFGDRQNERMRIDSAGRVTMPYQPMVHAAKNNGAFTASGGIWICNRNDVNVGGHYNNSTGVFTAPVTGLYYVSFFVLAQANHNFDIGFRKNGSQYSEMDIRCNNGAVNHNFTLSASALMNLATNDTADIYINANPGGTIYGNGLNGLQIMLVG